MVLLASKIFSAKCCQDLGDTGKAEALQAKELAPGISLLVLSGQAIGRRVLGLTDTPGGVRTTWECISKAHLPKSGVRVCYNLLRVKEEISLKLS